VKGRDHGQCLTEETLAEYLEGSLDPALKAASEVHLIACEKCRNQLAVFMRLLQPELNAEEAGVLEDVAAEWHTRTRNGPMAPRRRRWSRLLPALAAFAAMIVVLASLWILRNGTGEPKTPGEVVELLMAAQHRPFESRMSGQPHRPILRTRGIEDPGVSYTLLAGEMTKLSATSHDMGRFYLLQKDFTRAIPYLEMAEREPGVSPAVHNDLGVAYLENGIGAELDKAGQEFQYALQQDHSFAPAVFNLALFYERTNSTAQAETQWRAYLELDSKSEWADEAQVRLRGLRH
jgi:tetratricopeptide (TPR) repeat protein